MTSGTDEITRLAGQLAKFGPPVIIFNKSHSGSRLLARVLKSAGIFMGANCNESEDSLEMLRIVEFVVDKHYPAYSELFNAGDRQLFDLIEDAFSRHLAGMQPGVRWGWKLCETTFALPLFARLFPAGAFIHLLRDGRDVAFSDHVAPTTPFWRKVYFDAAAVRRWRSIPLTENVYRQRPHVFNAQHWVNSVRVGRAYGAMLADRYRELRYESLCCNFAATAASLFEWIGLDAHPGWRTWERQIDMGSIGKYRTQSSRKIAQAVAVLDHWLIAFGYANFSEVRSATRWYRFTPLI